MNAARAGVVLAIALGAVIGPAASAQAATTGRLGGDVPIAVVEVGLYRGIVHVRADASVDAVTYRAGVITWEDFHPEAAPPPTTAPQIAPPRAERPLAVSLLATATAGVTATIGAPTVRDLVVLDLVVPARAVVRVRIVHYGEITIGGTMGEVEADLFQGRIALLDLPGPALAHVGRDGDIHVRLTSSPSPRPMSFTTYEGDIELEVPVSIAPRLRAEAIQGEVRSELPSPPGAGSAPDDGDIRVTTARGVIHVRALR